MPLDDSCSIDGGKLDAFIVYSSGDRNTSLRWYFSLIAVHILLCLSPRHLTQHNFYCVIIGLSIIILCCNVILCSAIYMDKAQVNSCLING